jgi:hypothetical protein
MHRVISKRYGRRHNMAQKLDTTPDGIVCKECGADKPAYHFFKHSGKYTQDFFTTELGYTNGVCFDCAGDYRCITCHEVKPASEFRVQGRICKACKGSKASRNGAIVDTSTLDSGFNSIETLKSDGWGE